MSLGGSLLGFLTGGKDEAAQQSLNQAQQNFANVQVPTTQQLTLPQLQQYVDAGIMTPAQMQAYLQQTNALANENIDQTGTAAQMAALNNLSGIANAGAEGTPVEQAQQAQTIQQMNEAVGGQRGAIEQAAEARGTPAALVQAALSNQTAGQDAEQAYQNALQSQGQAYQTALNAMSQGANVGQNLQGQQNTQANTVAQAQNAMQQFNAANQQNAAAANAARQQEVNAYNAQNAQNLSNTNTQNANQRTAYNANIPNTVYGEQMGKANAQAGISSQQAGLNQQQGQQTAAIYGGLMNFLAPQPFVSQSAGSTIGGGGGGGGFGSGAAGGGGSQGASAYGFGGAGNAGYQANNQMMGEETLGAAVGAAHGGIIDDHSGCYHDGGLCMKEGAIVPGQAKVPGDSLRNDTVKANVSPGEAVIPRTAVQQHMPEVLSLLSGRNQPTHHPQDVKTLLEAMRAIRTGV